MFYRIFRSILFSLSLILILGFLTSCDTEDDISLADGDAEVIEVDESGNTTVDLGALSNALNQIPINELSNVEAEGLLYMREEEKLARDVYLRLFEEWAIATFQNISDSEQTHTDAVKSLIDRYELRDPAAGKDIGLFTDPTLQDLHDTLVEEGKQSLSSALRVGAAIEEIDILDLEERIALTDKIDIKLVYENLMKGSRNHLRSFVSALKNQTGETYQPQYLSQEVYDSIINTPIERGSNRTL